MPQTSMMNFIIHLSFLFFLVVCSVKAYDIEVDSMMTVRLQHYLSSDSAFEDRGNITIHSTRTGSVALVQAGLLPNQIQLLKSHSEMDGFYRLHASVVNTDGRITSFLTFMKACTLVESKLTDLLTISLDHTGGVVAVSISVPFVVCKGFTPADHELRHFNTTVIVKHMESGPIPDTASYIQKLEREREARERGDPKDNRSFIVKYWMYIVPLLIFVLLSSAGQPEGTGAGAGR